MAEENRQYMKRCTFPEMWDESVLKYGDRPCQYWRNEQGGLESIDYARAGQIVKELSNGLISLGMHKQDRAAIMSANCPEWLWSDFAILNAGGVAVTIYPSLSPRETAFILKDSGASVLFVQNEALLTKIYPVISELPNLQHIVAMQGTALQNEARVMNLASLREAGRLFMNQFPLAYEKRWRSVDLFDRMTVIYTSGTTGIYRGVVHTHFSINAANNRDLKVIPEVSNRDVLLSVIQLSHSYERQFGQMLSLMIGGAIAYSRGPGHIMADMAFFRPTWMMGVPAIYEEIFSGLRQEFGSDPARAEAFEQALNVGMEVLEARSDQDGFVDMSPSREAGEDVSPLLFREYLRLDQEVLAPARELLGGRFRFGISAAGALPRDLCRAFLAMGLPITEGYGLIETCNTVTLNPLNRILPGSVGPVVSGTEVKVGEDGELYVRSDNTSREYWNNPEASLAAFTPDGYLMTGDIVEFRPDGYMRLVDRKKSLIVLDTGEKVATAKVENLFAMSPGISQVCALGDGYNHIGLLIVPNFEFFMNHLDKAGMEFDREAIQYASEGGYPVVVRVGLDLIQHPVVKDAIAREVAAANERLEDYEAIRRYLVINRRFTIQTDEMTPTMKLKRKAIARNFAMEIERMYADS